MKKRIAAWMITTIFALTVAGCSQDNSFRTGSRQQHTQEETDVRMPRRPQKIRRYSFSDTGTAQEGQSESSNVRIAYFSVPEDVDTEGIDANAGASIVVRDGQVMGNLEYMANVIQQTIGETCSGSRLWKNISGP